MAWISSSESCAKGSPPTDGTLQTCVSHCVHEFVVSSHPSCPLSSAHLLVLLPHSSTVWRPHQMPTHCSWTSQPPEAQSQWLSVVYPHQVCDILFWQQKTHLDSKEASRMRQWLGRERDQRCQDKTSTVCSCCSEEVIACCKPCYLCITMLLFLLPPLSVSPSVTNVCSRSSLASMNLFLPSCLTSLSPR